ncbi:MAG: hypothetical protein IKR52_08355, partial [Paludibacteraceae bacterium]|nr:hypothetical protein [Paludibacteraceae bacterium]
KKLKSDYDEYTRKETENHNERLKEAIERQDEKVNSLTKLVEEYIENELPQDSIARCRERLKEASDKLKELKAAKDTEWDEKMAKRKDLYETLKTLIGKARVGYYFAYNDNIYCVTQISLANEDANIYSAPSNINIKLACTDPLNNKGLDLNFAETGMNYLLELTRKKSDERSYDSFIKNDTRREEVSIITGNIVPYLSEQGIVITRYTLADGSMENGIVVKPVLRDGILQMPDYCKYATIPLNTKTIKPISKSLTSESRVYFRNIAYHGQFYIEGRRYGDYMHFFLGADAGYKNFLANEEVLDCLRTNDKIPYRNGIFSIEIPDVDSLLSIMTKQQFSAQINFSAIDSYADALDFSKYKPKDWAKLSYDRNKIPTDYKGHKAQNTSISALLLAEMALISESDTLEVEIIDYSEKSWAVIGGSKREWTILKNAGAKYNSHLSVGAGWILPKSKYTKAQILKLVA